MRVALMTSFKASRKDPLGSVLERIHGGFVNAGLDEPVIQFTFADGPLPGMVSSVDRVLKRFPDVDRFVSTGSMLPASPPVRRISNGPGSSAAGERLEFATLAAIAAGVPRSFPFHNIAFHFQSPAFGMSPVSVMGFTLPGILVGDSWWVNGRNRSVAALMIVDADPASKKLPAPSASVQAVLAACGKATSTTQIPYTEQAPSIPAGAMNVAPEAARAAAAIMIEYKNRLAEVIDRAALPHDLPSSMEVLKTTPLGQTTGPKKPVLVSAFKPMGYDCRSESGTFTLRRRTPNNITVEISLDVGTWSRSLTANLGVYGLGFGVTLPLYVSKRAMDGWQYSIGNAERWQQIVDNLAALVAELDRTFVKEVEAAVGPSPAWYKPES